MLWMKAWLETRWRFAQMSGMAVLVLGMGLQGGGLGTAEHAGNLIVTLYALSIIAAVNLAGAGIRTQPPFRRRAGLHGSTYYTLALPVSRFRLLAVRAAAGLLETSGLNIFMIVSAWALFPLVRGDSTIMDLLRLVLTAIGCTAWLYFVSVLIATVLDDIWQMFGSLFTIGLAWWMAKRFVLPPSADMIRFLGEASPLVTHRLPWPAISVSVMMSALLLWVSLKIVQSHEY